MTRLCRLTPAICAFHLGFSLDFVLEVSDQQIPVQVDYRRSIDPVGDTRGIMSFWIASASAGCAMTNSQVAT